MTQTEQIEHNKTVTRQPCEIYSRVVGYIRPITGWNDSKKAEYKDRVNFKMEKL